MQNCPKTGHATNYNHRTRKGLQRGCRLPRSPRSCTWPKELRRQPAGTRPSASVHLGLPGNQPENTARLSPHPNLPPAPPPSGDFRSCKSSQGHPSRSPFESIRATEDSFGASHRHAPQARTLYWAATSSRASFMPSRGSHTHTLMDNLEIYSKKAIPGTKQIGATIVNKCG